MRKYTIEYYMDLLRKELQRNFLDEQFLSEELDGVMQGLINSLRWSALRAAQLQVQNGQLFKIDSLNTLDHFSTEQMSRDEIVARIEDTSGLNDAMAKVALKLIENSVDRVVFESQQDLFIEHIGTIRGAENPGYSIELSDTLRVLPKSNSAFDVTA